MSQTQAAELLGIGRRPTLSEWESRKAAALSPQYEVKVRAVYLSEFLELLDGKATCHLTDAQHLRLKDFAQAYYQICRKLLSGSRGKLEPHMVAMELTFTRKMVLLK